MNKIKFKLNEAAESKFDETWQKEVERLKNLYYRYQNEVEAYRPDQISNKDQIRTYQEKRKQFEKEIFGDKFSQLSKMKRKRALDLYNLFNKFDKNGINTELTEERSRFIRDLTQKMNRTIEKYLDDGNNITGYHDIENIKIDSTNKGYKFSGDLDNGDYIETECIIAGGNIQCLHHRYITRIIQYNK